MLTAVEAICTDEFNIHGVLATTMPVGPVIVASGPGTRAIGMNAGVNALGQGNRANLTIGRAVQLVVRNVGGGRPGGVDRAAHGNPGKLSFCFAELADSPFGTLAESRGATAGADAVTVFAGEGPRCIVDQISRDPESLATSLASCLRTLHHPKLVLGFDAILVVGPEHARVFAEAGWDRARVLAELDARLQIPGSELVRGAGGIAEGVPESFADATLPKFRPGGILLAYAGGGAGLFSAMIGGWANGDVGSQPVTREVRSLRSPATQAAMAAPSLALGRSQRGGCPMTRYVLDPTGERNVAERQRLDRPAAIAGLRVGLLDISKPRGDVFLDRLEARLAEAGASVQRYRKPTFTKPAPVDLRHEIATQCDLVIEALAD